MSARPTWRHLVRRKVPTSNCCTATFYAKNGLPTCPRLCHGRLSGKTAVFEVACDGSALCVPGEDHGPSDGGMKTAARRSALDAHAPAARRLARAGTLTARGGRGGWVSFRLGRCAHHGRRRHRRWAIHHRRRSHRARGRRGHWRRRRHGHRRRGHGGARRGGLWQRHRGLHEALRALGAWRVAAFDRARVSAGLGALARRRTVWRTV